MLGGKILFVFLGASVLLINQPGRPSLLASSWSGQIGLKAGELFRDRLKSGSEGPEMVVISSGKFPMGDIQDKHGNDELPVREVVIKRSFAVSRYEVTFDQYDDFAKGTVVSCPTMKVGTGAPAGDLRFLERRCCLCGLVIRTNR
jgi:formylglycine-generating enzyme required for sulfatase activity